MARKLTTTSIPQNYPRIQEGRYRGYIDDATLVPHFYKIPENELKKLIVSAIKNANLKSSREAISLPNDAALKEIQTIYKKEGKKLFQYFKQYVGDPASTAHQIFNKSYIIVGKEQFRNRTLQKERMNSGWRYQFLALSCAQSSKRFKSVSDIGTAETDFNAVIEYQNKDRSPLTLYVSMKNCRNTMGGQDWPKAIRALEAYAINDRNRIGEYCCVFGIAMDRGTRYIKTERKSGQAHSYNTEIWLSDFFWPFFANHGYEEIMTAVLNILMENYQPENLSSEIDMPEEMLESFGDECRKAGLVNDNGIFNDPYKLVEFFCNK